MASPPSPGAAVGRVVFDSESAVARSAAGDDVILVRRETNPDDPEGMIAAVGVLTNRGAKTSHAAVVARGMGRTCVCGAESNFGRILAAYGGVFVAGSLAWGMVADGFKPDRWDVSGALICLVGVAVIMYAPQLTRVHTEEGSTPR